MHSPHKRSRLLALSVFGVILLMLASAPWALARSSYRSQWESRYPGSLSLANTGPSGSECNFCHGNTLSQWNGYGWDLRVRMEAPFNESFAEAMASVEFLDSDVDPTGSDNLTEANASTQPGWTDGANNTLFNDDFTTVPNQLPPAGIAGELDPAGAEPDIDVNPLTLDFGTVTIGMIATLTTTIENVGSADLTVTGLTLTGSTDFALGAGAPALPFTVAPMGTVDLPLDYMPSDVGGDTGSLDIASDDPDEPSVLVSLAGIGEAAPEPDIAVAPLTLDFGTVTIGMTASLSTTVSNLGNADLTVSALALTGSTDFALGAGAPALPFTVAPGGMIDVPVDYAPSDVGSDMGSLDIASDDPDEPSVLVSLAGIGEAAPEPDIAVAPLTLDFGTVTIGMTASLSTTVSNLGNADLTVSALALTGSTDFALGAGAPALPFTVAPGGMIDVPVDYAPSDVGSDIGSLDIASDDPDEPSVLVSLAGIGEAAPEPDIAVAPLTLDFGTVTIGMTASLSTTVSNLGNADLTVSALALTGSTDFALGAGAPALPFTVAPGGMIDVPVDYAPSDVGSDIGSLDIASDDPDEPSVLVSLAGIGEAAPEPDIAVAPLTLDFGTVTIGMTASLSTTVSNLGNADLTVSALALTGSTDFALGAGAPALPFTVAPGGMIDVPVDYAPSDVGSDIGSLDIASDDPDEPSVLVSLAGIGEAAPEPDIAVAPLTLDFGTVTIGMTASLSTTVSNLGNADLTVSALALTGSTDFALGAGAPALPFTVAPGGMIDVPVDYAPSDVGSDIGSLDIASDDPDEPSVLVSLAGIGEAAPEPDIAVAPLTLDYGTVTVGMVASLSTTISNLGTADLTVTALNLTGSTDFALGAGAPALPFSVAPGGMIDVPVDYSPLDVGTDLGNLEIVSNDADEPSVSVSLTGEGIPTLVPDIDVAPLTLDFGAVTIGMTGSLSTTISNLGNADLTVSALALTGSTDFALGAGAPALPFTVAPGGMIDVPVDYAPSDVGSDIGSLDIASDDPDEPSVFVSLSGVGEAPPAPDIAVAPLALDFGTVTTGMTASLSTTISNLGNADLTVTALNLTGSTDFALGAGAPALPFSVAPGGMIDVPVDYSPLDVGTDLGNLDIVSNDADEPSVSVSLTGEGIPPLVPDIAVAPLALDFGTVTTGMTASLSTTISNLGNADLTVTALNLTGSTDFALGAGAPALPFSVAPGGMIDVPVDYSPLDVGTDLGNLDIVSNDADEPSVSVSLTGEGIPPLVPDIAVAPLALDFGTVTTGMTASLSTTISNLGTADLTVTALNLSGSTDFALGAGAPALPFSVAPGGMIDVPVDYAPLDVGTDLGNLDIVSNDADEPSVSVSLTGEGIPPLVPDIDVAPLTLDFGTVTIGMTGSLSATVSNLGTVNLTVSALALSGSTDFTLGVGAPTLPFTLMPGEMADVPVDYAPVDVGADLGSLEITSDDPDEGLVTVSLSGVGEAPPAPDIDVAPLTLSFGDVETGTTATDSTTIMNLGTADLIVNLLIITGSPDFALGAGAPATPFSVAPGGMIDVPVDYSPLDIGADMGSVEIVSNDPIEPSVLVALAGVGVPPPAPEIDVSPLALDFGTVTTGMTASLTTTIENLGTADLTVSALSLSGSLEFALGAGAPSLPFSVAPGGMVDVPVDYVPVDEGTDNGQLEIVSDDADEPSVFVSLTGTGVAPVLDPDINVVPTTLDFGNVFTGTSMTLTTSVQNMGSADLIVDGLALSGSMDFMLGVGAPMVPFVVPPGGMVDVPVVYTPDAAGPDVGTLAVTSNDPDEPLVNVDLLGTGVELVVDLDIQSFRTKNRVKLSNPRPVAPRISVKNSGSVDEPRMAQLVGVQNGMMIYDMTMLVSDPVGNGPTTYEFPEYVPTALGDIVWTLTLMDDDPDIDVATRTTNVVP